ncbi:MAG TPA: vWA domain-containing protein [Thermoanaerobaculia bacterium]|nr:vWA domain-containing protein [Thermoanaerobaculia bacterium]
MLIHRALKSAAIAAAVVLLSLTFTGTARAQQCGSMDVTFIVDETGSMTNVIANLQGQVSKIADEVVKASGGDYQFALIGMPDNNLDVLLNFAKNNRADLATAIGKLATSGGCGGVPYDEAINTAVHSLKARAGSSGAQLNDFTSTWRANTKIVIIITDTLPQAFTCAFQPGVHDKAAHDFAADAEKAGIHITMVYVPTGNTPEDTIKAIMQDVTATSEGFFKEAKSDASDVSDIIQDIIKNCGGAQGGTGTSNLLIEPQEIVLLNGQSGDVHITNFNPSTATAQVSYSAEFAEEDDFTTKFTPIAKPASGTEEQTMTIGVGERTLQGTHLIGIRASKGVGADDFAIIHVIVDCMPPFFLSSGQPQNASVARGATTQLKATPNGDGPFRYQWYRGHAGITTFPIAGATGATLTTDTAAAGTAEYWVRVENACGSRDSATAVVTSQ